MIVSTMMTTIFIIRLCTKNFFMLNISFPGRRFEASGFSANECFARKKVLEHKDVLELN